MGEKEEEGPYGYYLFGCHIEHGYSYRIFEFFNQHNQEEELEARITELLNNEEYPYLETDLYVIRGNRLMFTAEKEVVRCVDVKF